MALRQPGGSSQRTNGSRAVERREKSRKGCVQPKGRQTFHKDIRLMHHDMGNNERPWQPRAGAEAARGPLTA